MKKFIPPFILVITSLWLGWTMLVDFFIIPTVFKHVDDFFQAGFLGIAVFSRLNSLEILAATSLVSLTSLNVKKDITTVVAFVASLILFTISILYFVYLTPKIITLTELWRKADLMGLIGLRGIADLQQEHQFYHRLYIGIDTVKLGLLLILMGFGVFRSEQWK